ncbi:hypothetical protein C1T17_17985 [Sphingobium sp. SCG-1]|uniref:enoyl-CoA hydratase-related protein n=1 Tax=Sphingobium sp. SCG-1 TaxID=2072936 RepID=UPI000CD6B005|nr:enoyl-CoA hydratase-related protein [Sphingobium sp. SCG-1]AUW59695.1 hypothetical protein C1T17_17985 [Sphingobium sp. SCG-1]
MVNVGYYVAGPVAVITLNAPPVNAFGFEHRAAIGDAIDQATQDRSVKAIVVTGQGKGFSAGADISKHGSQTARQEPRAPTLQKMLINSGKLTIAAIHGFALGGGLELALACDARVAEPAAVLGLTEVDVGLLAGGGGTQRLTRLTGADVAIDLLSTGRRVYGAEALELGLIDAIVQNAQEGGVAFALEALAKGAQFTPTILRMPPGGDPGPVYFYEARALASRRSPGALAPIANIDCVEAACRLSPEDGLAVETEKCEELLRGDQPAALKHMFFAERAARSVAGIENIQQSTRIGRITVAGVCHKATQICATLAARGGYRTILFDQDSNQVVQGKATIAQDYAKAVVQGRMSSDEAEAALSRITCETRLDALSDTDIAIQATDIGISSRQSMLLALATAIPEGILATILSGPDIDALAATLPHPQRLVGVHTFPTRGSNKILEVVPSVETNALAIRSMMDLGRQMGAISVLSGNSDGFIGPRMLRRFRNMAELLALEGVAIERIAAVAGRFGMTDALASMALSDRGGSAQARITDTEIGDRLFLPLVNEGAKLLEEGVALKSSDIDIVCVKGFGFPAVLGGPIYWGDRIGLARVLEMANELSAIHGQDWAASPLLRVLVKECQPLSSFQSQAAAQLNVMT